MFKIDGTINNTIGLQSGGEKTRQSEAATSFSQIMEKAVMECEKLQASMGAEACQAVAATTSSELPPLWHQIDGLLSCLDEYGQSLADPNATLKQIGPLVDQLEQEASRITDQMNQGQIKGDLAELAEQAVAQAQVETIKFRRGDYV